MLRASLKTSSFERQSFRVFLICKFSGRTGGRFMKKTRMRKPESMQSPDLTLDSLYYCPQDLYVGAIVEFNKHTFLLTSADEYVYSYMERPKEVETFPQSNLRIIKLFRVSASES